MEKTQAKTILGIGNPIIDISAETDAHLIHKFGLEWGRTVFADDNNRGIYDAIEQKEDCVYIAGGSVTNSIRVANWFLQNHPDYQCTILGCIGDDDYGKKLVKALEDVNVKPIFEVNKEHATSRCAVGVHLKERCLIPEIRASTHLSDSFIQENKEKILNTDLFFIEGYFVKERFDLIMEICKEFKAQNKPIALSLSATFMIEYYHDLLKQVADLADLIICNDEEANYFSGNKNETCIKAAAENIHRKLAENPNRLLIVTCGKRPTQISKWNYEQNTFDFVLQSFVYPIKDDDIVDTNGCGDAFVGGFISQFIQGRSLELCARAGNYAASIIIKNVGCTFPHDCDFELKL